jgi:hypothetical protein
MSVSEFYEDISDTEPDWQSLSKEKPKYPTPVPCILEPRDKVSVLIYNFTVVFFIAI